MSYRVIPTWAALALLGAATAAAQVWEVGEKLVQGASTPQNEAQWGDAVAAGDLNCDGISDLAIAGPWYDYFSEPPTVNSGSVFVYFGEPGGIVAHDGGWFSLFEDERFGTALAIGDFDGVGGGCARLVVARPGRERSGQAESGMVSLFRWNGSAWEDPPQNWWQTVTNSGADEDEGDHFGEVLAVGNFDGDEYLDLAIGIPGENLESPTERLDAGAVIVLFGTAAGLDDEDAQLITEDALGGGQAGARFGSALAAGDFDDDGYADLAVGVPDRDVDAGGVKADAGEVVVLFGSGSGLTTSGYLRFDDADFGGAVAAGDRFGAALAAADFDLTLVCAFLETCHVDLAIGIPGEPVSGQAGAGGVVVAYGSASGPDTGDFQFFSQENLSGAAAAGETPEAGDGFGWRLVAGSFDGRVGADLAVAAPSEQNFFASDGAAHLLFGGSGGIASYPDQLVVRYPGMKAAPTGPAEGFGTAMAFGDFDADGHTDGAFGIPGFANGGVGDSGVVQILYGAVFADGFESGAGALWSNSLGLSDP